MVLIAIGCQSKGSFYNSDLGVSMDLPKGWAQGEPRASGGFRKTSSGACFQDMKLPEQEGFACGCVYSYLLRGRTFDEYVANLVAEQEKQARAIEAFGKIAEQMAQKPPETPMGESIGTLLESAADMTKQIAAAHPSREDITVGAKKAIKLAIEGPNSHVTDYYIDAGDRVVYINFEVPLTKTKIDKYQPLVDGMVRSIKVK